MALLLTASLSACQSAARHRSHGHKIDTDLLSDITVGEDTADDVRELLGPPTNIGNFDRHAMYYIFQFTEQKAFFDPKVLERQIIRVDLDDQEVVQGIKTLSEKDGREIEVAERESPTVGKDLNFLQEIMGNVGRFRKPH